jgi:hypothetical protein
MSPRDPLQYTYGTIAAVPHAYSASGKVSSIRISSARLFTANDSPASSGGVTRQGLRSYPGFAPLRRDPRFQRLLLGK